jgi:hypothetical protein
MCFVFVFGWPSEKQRTDRNVLQRQIVVCTDGLSNVGLGQLDDINTEEKKRASERFYEQIGYAMWPRMGNHSLHTHILTLPCAR